MIPVGPNTVVSIVDRYMVPWVEEEWAREQEHRREGPDYHVNQAVVFDQDLIGRCTSPETVYDYVQTEVRRGLYELVGLIADPSRFGLIARTFLIYETDDGVPARAGLDLSAYYIPKWRRPQWEAA